MIGGVYLNTKDVPGTCPTKSTILEAGIVNKGAVGLICVHVPLEVNPGCKRLVNLRSDAPFPVCAEHASPSLSFSTTG